MPQVRTCISVEVKPHHYVISVGTRWSSEELHSPHKDVPYPFFSPVQGWEASFSRPAHTKCQSEFVFLHLEEKNYVGDHFAFLPLPAQSELADWQEFIAVAEGSSGCPEANFSPVDTVYILCFCWALPLLNLAAVRQGLVIV